MEIRSLHFVIAMVAGWLQREQGEVIAYLKEENKVLRKQLGGTQIKFTDSQRRRLARKGKLVGRRGLLDLGYMAMFCRSSRFTPTANSMT